MHKAKNIKIKIRFPIPFRCFAALNMTIIIVLPRHSEQSEESKNCRNRCFAALNMTIVIVLSVILSKAKNLKNSRNRCFATLNMTQT